MKDNPDFDMQKRKKRLLTVKSALDNPKGREQEEVEAIRGIYERLLENFKKLYPNVEIFGAETASSEKVITDVSNQISDSLGRERFGIFYYLFGCNYTTAFSEHTYKVVFKRLVKQTYNAPTIDEFKDIVSYLNSCFFYEISNAFRVFHLSDRLVVDLYEDEILIGKNLELQVFTDWNLSGKADDISFSTTETDGFPLYYGTYVLRKIGKEMLELWNSTMMGLDAIPESCRLSIEDNTSNKVFDLQFQQSNSYGILARSGSKQSFQKEIPIVIKQKINGKKGIDQLDKILQQGLVYRKQGQKREVWDYRDNRYYTIIDYNYKGPYISGHLYVLTGIS